MEKLNQNIQETLDDAKGIYEEDKKLTWEQVRKEDAYFLADFIKQNKEKFQPYLNPKFQTFGNVFKDDGIEVKTMAKIIGISPDQLTDDLDRINEKGYDPAAWIEFEPEETGKVQLSFTSNT